ncbi:hypothetical protein JCM16358_25430 [Halanaerocella petrolearia]
MKQSSFNFLRKDWPKLAKFGRLAEKNLNSDPNTTLIKLRLLAEHIVKYIFEYQNLDNLRENTLFNRLKYLERKDIVSKEMLDILHNLRSEGNKAAHDAYDSREEAKRLLNLAAKISFWFMETYSDNKNENTQKKDPMKNKKSKRIAKNKGSNIRKKSKLKLHPRFKQELQNRDKFDNKAKSGNYKYAILPVNIDSDNSKRILQNSYAQKSFIDSLSFKHRFIPEVAYERISLEYLNECNYNLIPQSSKEWLFTFKQEILTSEKKDFNLKNNYDKSFPEINQNLKKLNQGLFKRENIGLILPVFGTEENLYQRDDIANKIGTNIKWLKNLINFFSFLTKEGYKIKAVKNEISSSTVKEDVFNNFLYNKQGEIKYFINYNSLSINHKSQKMLSTNNLTELYRLLKASFSVKGIANNINQLYQENNNFKIIYDNLENGHYHSFEEIKQQFDGQKIKRSQKIGVFLDVANIFKGIGARLGNLNIDFGRLLDTIYNAAENKDKYATLFYPTFPDNPEATVRQAEKQDQLKKYLERWGFNVLEVENGTPKSKLESKRLSSDDQALINKMEDLINDRDSILIMSGDSDFYEIASKYQQLGKEVKIISISTEDTDDSLLEGFEHYYLSDFWDCIEIGERIIK